MPSDEDHEKRTHRRSGRRHDDDDEPPRDKESRHSRRKHSDREHDHRRSRRDGERRRSQTPPDSTTTTTRPRRRRSRSREQRRHRHRSRSRQRGEDSHRKRQRRDDEDKRGTSPVRRSGPLPSQQDSFAIVTKGDGPDEEAKPKEKANWSNSGVLAAASNSVAQADGTSITLKYHEPAEARKPSPRDQWKLFVFKGADVVDTVDLSARSCWLVGREAAVVDLPAEHPSISKQHAVIQFRHTEKRNEFGDRIGSVKPYLIDLESANGTTLNGDGIPDSRYLELRDKDVVQFGHSTREYVVMLAPRD